MKHALVMKEAKMTEKGKKRKALFTDKAVENYEEDEQNKT